MRTKAEILIVTANVLVIQVDVEEFARVPRLGNRMHKVEPGHHLVGKFWVDTHHLWVVESGDKAEHGTGGGQVNVTTGLIRFGFQGKLVAIALIDIVFTEKVERLAEPLAGVKGTLARVGLGPFAATPEDIDLRP